MFRHRAEQPASGETMAGLVRHLRRARYIRTEAVERALLRADRRHFVPSSQASRAYLDAPLPIGHDQTISAPHMVAIMAEALEAQPGMRVLEVGGGSGWHAAVIAGLVGPGGRVISVERVDELAQQARENLQAAGYAGLVEVVVGDGSVGHKSGAPYDRISVAAAAPRVPGSLVDQLSRNLGRLIVPVGPRSVQELIAVTRDGGRVRREELGGCVFVPLLGKEGF